MATHLAPGDKVPSFTLTDQDGKTFDSKTLQGKRHVIFFYPKDNTPGCTQEACGFRDAFEELQEHDVEVVGISSDSVVSHNRFAAKLELPFKLLSDNKGTVRKLFGVKGILLGLIPDRVTFVIDEKGHIIHVVKSMLNIDKHLIEVKHALKISH